MQVHCTTLKKKSEVPEDDGRSLLAVDQYRLELKQIRRFGIVEERRLADLARVGDEEAGNLLIENCLGYVFGYATHYSLLHTSNSDVMDLVQVGNEAMYRHLPSALKSRYVCGFLKVVAKNDMVSYCVEDKMIRVPFTSFFNGKRGPLTVSLTAPLYCDGAKSILDFFEDADWQEAERAFDLAGV